MRGSSSPTRKTWRWLLAVAGVLLLVGVLPPLMLAQWGPYILGRALSAYLQRSVTVQGVVGGWWNGMTLQQLTSLRIRHHRRRRSCGLNSLTINLPLVSLLLSSKPMALHLEAAHIDLRKRQDGQWNLTPLLRGLGSSTSARPQARAIVPQLGRQITVTVSTWDLARKRGSSPHGSRHATSCGRRGTVPSPRPRRALPAA